MLSETMTVTRTWTFKSQKDWRVYIEKASQITPKLIIFSEEDRMNSLDFIDYMQTKWDSKLLTTVKIKGARHVCYL